MSIVIEHVTKRFDGYPVVNNVSLEVQTGEFFILLGSSGSGKTTILNLIAGLTPLDTGKIFLHGKDVTYLPTQKRQVGYVFQQYALFQHMTVAENIEFGPSLRKIPRSRRMQRCEELLEMVSLTGLGNRYPRQLSGGQQQRVALARALANDPELLLLDEPFGALDASIRVELRRTLRSIQRELGITTILVTHDQDEAFDLADRIGVMNFGRLVEVGIPADLYQHPQTELVASFLGSANLLVGSAYQGNLIIGALTVEVPILQDDPDPTRRVQVLFRPEDVALAASPNELDCASLSTGEVEETSFNGPSERLRLRIPAIPGVRPIVPAVPFGERSILLEASRSPDEAVRFPLEPGSKVSIGIRRTHVLPAAGLTCLILIDGSTSSQAVCTAAGQIARMSHARVTLLGCGMEASALAPLLEEAKKQLGSGLAALNTCVDERSILEASISLTEQQPYDLIIMGSKIPDGLPEAQRILRSGSHSLLLVPETSNLLSHALMYVSQHELTKRSTLLPGRLLYHTGADATLMTVLSPEDAQIEFRMKRSKQFLDDSSKSVSLLGVQVNTVINTGQFADEITREANDGKYNFIIMTTPGLIDDDHPSIEGELSLVFARLKDFPILLVQPPADEHVPPSITAQ